MITIIAEKFDNAGLIISALSGIEVDGKTINADQYDKYKNKIEKKLKPRGYVEIEYEGQGYYVTWAQGHLLELKQAKDYNADYANWKNIKIPFIPDEYELQIPEGIDFKTRKRTGAPNKFNERQLGIMDKLLSNSDSIINALDDDREGELIYKLIVDYLGYSDMPFKKIVLDTMTTDGIRKSFSNLKDEDNYRLLSEAGYGRMIADWVVGVNLTTVATLHYADNVMIPLGRVQTPVLNMIVERENEIMNFKPEPFWNIEANFEAKDGVITAKHEHGRYSNQALAKETLAKLEGKPGHVIEYETKPTQKHVPMLYDLAELQKTLNKSAKFSASKTLDLVQELYMAGLLSYPRTDSRYLTDDMTGVVDSVLDMLSGMSEYSDFIVDKDKRNYDMKRHFNTKKVSSHYAIIPTTKEPGKLNNDQQIVYDTVVKSVLKMVYKPAEFEQTNITFAVEDETFKASGNVLIDPQWMIIEDMKEDKTLPKVSLDEALPGEYEIKEGQTNPPKRFTEASLITAMENVGKTMDDEELKDAFDLIEDGGLGRPATRAGIIENVIKRYCKMEKNQIVPGKASMKLIENLKLEAIKSPKMTAKWEIKLDEIAHGQLNVEDFVHAIEEQVEIWSKEMIKNKPKEPIFSKKQQNQTDMVCPACGSPIRKLKKGYMCSNFDTEDKDKCRFMILYNLWGGVAKVSDAQAIKLIKNGRSGLIKGFKKKSGDGTYDAYLVVEKNGSLKLDFGSGLTVTCPKCGGEAKDNGFGLSCENNRYKDPTSTCDFFLSRKRYNKKLTDTEMKKIVKNWKTKK